MDKRRIISSRYAQAIRGVGDIALDNLLAKQDGALLSEHIDWFIGLPYDVYAMPLLMEYIARKARDGGMIFLASPVQAFSDEGPMQMNIVDFKMRLAEPGYMDPEMQLICQRYPERENEGYLSKVEVGVIKDQICGGGK